MSAGNYSFLAELRRRRVFRVAAIYIVAAWIVVQVASEAFPAIDVPEPNIRYVWLSLILGFPVALVFGWRFDIIGGRIAHTPSADSAAATGMSLQRADYFILAALVLVAASIVIGFGRQILLRQPALDAAARAVSIPARSIAVLPLENISNMEENAAFTDGIHDDLLTQLAKISSLKVISRTSVQQYRHTTKSAPQIATELGVATILEGGVQRSGNNVRINVQLIDARSDAHLWAETYDRDLTTRNVYAIQTEIAENITAALDSALTPADREQLEKVPTDNLDAYFAYLLGKQRMTNRNSDSLQQAADKFRDAIKLDPDYALAYVGLANTYMLLGDYGDLSLHEMLAKALPALTAALHLDDRLAEAHTSMGAISAKTRNYAAAEASFARAMDLDPNYALAYHWYGDVLVSFLGRPEDALPLLQRAIELDPLSPALNITLGQSLENLGRFDEAMSQYLQTIEIEPAYASPYLLIGDLYRFVYGQLDEGIRWRFKGMARDPGMALGLSRTGVHYLDLGGDAEAEYWINGALALAPDQFVPNSGLAYLYRYRNDGENALRIARKLQTIAPGNNDSLLMLVTFGQYREALDKFGGIYPELMCDDEPLVTRSNFFPALNLSLALENTGAAECATAILNKIIVRSRELPRMGSRGYGIADVEAYARLGRRDDAIASLRLAMDSHYRALWWAQGLASPHTTALRDDPEFNEMMEEIKADMAAQLTRVREMQRNGELPEIPVKRRDSTPSAHSAR